MRTREDIEAYLNRAGHPHREIDEHTWLVTDISDAQEQIVVRMTNELVLFRMKLMDAKIVTDEQREHFYERLLQLNAEDMVHGAYGLSDGDLVLIASLRVEQLDYIEFSSALADFSLAVVNHYPQLSKYCSSAS